MTRTNLLIGLMITGLLLLNGCGTVSSSSTYFSRGAAHACGEVLRAHTSGSDPDPTAVSLCNSYYDVRLWENLESKLNGALISPIRVTPLPCLADGPGCGWPYAYHQSLKAGFLEVFGDPSPQPNAPLSFEIIAPEVQLEKAIGLRKSLMQVVTDLDDQIETLRSAVDE
jgi:hypothetical protein